METITLAQPDLSFRAAIEKECGENINLCFQCMKCATGCPVAYTMDLTPSQIIHAVRLGQRDLALNSSTIWLCASCETCTTRCPQDLDIARIMDAVRIHAQREGIKPKVPEIQKFYETACGNIRHYGRMFEVGLIMVLKMKTLQFFKDMILGMKMGMKGKLKVWPRKTENVAEVREIFDKVKAKEAQAANEKGADT